WQIAQPLPPPPKEPTASPRWLTWAQEHLAQVISLAGLIFFVMKLLAVSKFNPATALALATSAGAGQVILGAVLLGYPFLMIALAAGGLSEFLRDLRTPKRSPWQ